jgi:heptosyltransferase II
LVQSLLIQTSFLGDAILTTPLIRELAARGPVDVVTTPASAALLANDPHVRRVVAYDKRGDQAGLGALRRLAGRVRADAPTAVAYLAQGSLRSAALAWLAGYRTRVGFDTSAGRWLYTRRVAYRRDRHHAERLLSLAVGDVTFTPERLQPALYPGDAERTAVETLLRAAGADDDPLLALAPGSIWATKRWPGFVELARDLTRHGRLVVIGSREDAELGRAITDAVGGAAVDATGRLSLLASAALIGRCRVLVSNDSAPQHMASAMGTPTVAIFGPTVPAFGFGPLAPLSIVSEVSGLACRPCHSHGPRQCPLGHWRCMRELSVIAVGDSARTLLERART